VRQSGPPAGAQQGAQPGAAEQVVAAKDEVAQPRPRVGGDVAVQPGGAAANEPDLFDAQIAKSLWVPVDVLDDVIDRPVGASTGTATLIVEKPTVEKRAEDKSVDEKSVDGKPAAAKSAVEKLSVDAAPTGKKAGRRPKRTRFAAARSRFGLLGWAAAAVAVLSLAGLLGSGGCYVYHQRHADALNARRAAYLQTARQAVLNLTNITDDSAGRDIDRVLSVASGDLEQEFAQNKDAYQKVVQQIKIKATGEVVEAAIESEDAHVARVLVVATQTLTNAGTDRPQERNYRFRVILARDDQGAVTASGVEFVA
jgi:Mce-associated membrane protein